MDNKNHRGVTLKEFFISRYRAENGHSDARQTLVRVDDNGIIRHVDSQAAAITGFEASDLMGQSLTRLVAAGQDDPFSPGHRQRFESGRPVLLTLRHKDGFFFTARLTLRTDIRDSDQAASARIIRRSAEPLDPRLLELTEEAGQLGIWELDTVNNQVAWTDGLYRLLELKPGSDITPEQALFYCQGYQNRVRALFRRCMSTGSPFCYEFDLLTARQNIRRVRLTGRVLKSGPTLNRLGGTLIDLSRQQKQQQARDHANRLLAAVMAATDDLVAAVDTDLNLLCFNEAFRDQARQTFGVEPVEGANLGELLSGFPNERRLSRRLWQRAFERDQFVVEMPLAEQDRELPVYEMHYHRLLGNQGELLGAVQVARDLTTRARETDSRNYLSRHDPVTGLLNRREFIARLQRLARNSQQHQTSHGLLYLDLDHFSDFNSQAGNGAGDHYLRALAANLGTRVRQRDTLARLSGDTFAVLIENCSRAQLRKVADGLLQQIADFSFDWQGQPLATTASGGLLHLIAPSPLDPERLLDQAADLCQSAKAAGRHRFHLADTRADTLQEAESRARLANLQQSLADDGLVLVYQRLKPVASITWGDHIEILARLRDPNDPGTLLAPSDFLPIASQFDLAKTIDRTVISKTLTWLGQHRLLEPRIKYCGFNLSLATLLDDTFPDFLQAAMTSSPFEASCFCLEVRESDATQYPDETILLCEAARQIGCRVALDGAGASIESYSLASTLPVDIIKLDQTMMTHLHDDPVQQVMVEALHKIAAAAGKTTVATFIENDDTLRRVRGLGIHYGQGFRLSKPQPLDTLTPAAVELETGRIGGDRAEH